MLGRRLFGSTQTLPGAGACLKETGIEKRAVSTRVNGSRIDEPSLLDPIGDE